MVSTATLLIVGLGNPGGEYARTRHNIGFMLLDALHAKYGFAAWQSKHSGLLASGQIDGHKVLLLKPQTYMNLSGQAVLPVATFYKIKSAQVLVAQDEIDLPFGTLRQKQGGGDAGHNGLKSITAAIGKEYHRLRLGVGRPVAPNENAPVMDVADYVLQAFTADEQVKVEKWLAELVQNFPQILATLAKSGPSS